MKIRCKVEGTSVQSAGAASPCAPRPPLASSPSAGCHDACRGARHGQALATPCCDETHLQHKEDRGELYPPAFLPLCQWAAPATTLPPPRCPSAHERGALAALSLSSRPSRRQRGSRHPPHRHRHGALRRVTLRRPGWRRERRGRHLPPRRRRAAGRVTASAKGRVGGTGGRGCRRGRRARALPLLACRCVTTTVRSSFFFSRSTVSASYPP